MNVILIKNSAFLHRPLQTTYRLANFFCGAKFNTVFSHALIRIWIGLSKPWELQKMVPDWLLSVTTTSNGRHEIFLWKKPDSCQKIKVWKFPYLIYPLEKTRQKTSDIYFGLGKCPTEKSKQLFRPLGWNGVVGRNREGCFEDGCSFCDVFRPLVWQLQENGTDLGQIGWGLHQGQAKSKYSNSRPKEI